MGKHNYMSVKDKSIPNYRVAAKNIELMCYPKCMPAYQIWISLFVQLSKKMQDYLLDFALKQKVEIPLMATNKPDHYFFSSHFTWIYCYFSKEKDELKFRAYEKNNSYDCIINALNEVKILLNSGLHRSITGLDVIAHWLNEQYLPAHLREVFGHRSLSHEFLRELTELPKSKSPASLITTNNSRLSLDKILAGIKS